MITRLFFCLLFLLLISCNTNEPKKIPITGGDTDDTSNTNDNNSSTNTEIYYKTLKVNDETLPKILDKDDYNSIFCKVENDMSKELYLTSSYSLNSKGIAYEYTDQTFESNLKDLFISIGFTTEHGLAKDIYTRQFDGDTFSIPNNLCGVACTATWLKLLRFYDNSGNISPKKYEWTKPILKEMVNFYELFCNKSQDSMINYGLTADEIVNALNDFQNNNYYNDNWREIDKKNNFIAEWPPTPYLHFTDILYKSLKLSPKNPVIVGFEGNIENVSLNNSGHVMVIYGLIYNYDFEKYSDFDNVASNLGNSAIDDILYCYLDSASNLERILIDQTMTHEELFFKYNALAIIYNSEISNINMW